MAKFTTRRERKVIPPINFIGKSPAERGVREVISEHRGELNEHLHIFCR